VAGAGGYGGVLPDRVLGSASSHAAHRGDRGRCARARRSSRARACSRLGAPGPLGRPRALLRPGHRASRVCWRAAGTAPTRQPAWRVDQLAPGNRLAAASRIVVGAGVLRLPLVALGSIAHHDHPRVLPLPADLVAEQTSHGCGSSSCTREFTITSATHDTTDHMVAELRRFLTTSRGWSLDEHGSGCQQTGWLNADQLCVDIAADHDHVQLSIQESGPWT
jgi:hypothetical protein